MTITKKFSQNAKKSDDRNDFVTNHDRSSELLATMLKKSGDCHDFTLNHDRSLEFCYHCG